MSGPAIAGILLSGGASRRMGFPKGLLTIGGETFLDRLIRVFRTVCDPVIVVLGEHEAPIRAGITRGSEVRFVVNPDPERGMLSSLQCGLEAAGRADAVCFSPVDYPAIATETVRAVVSAFAAERAPVTIPTCDGTRGHPVCVRWDVVQELLVLPVTAQARDVIRAYRSRTCHVETGDPGILTDIDLPADYEALAGARA